MGGVTFIRALIVLHRTFARRGARVRLHTLVRFVTCPFLRVVRHVPAGGARRVGAVEPDVRKVRALDGVDVVAGYDACIRGAFDVVAVIDVLYKVPLAEWDAMLARIAARLRPGGLLIIKEQDPTARVRSSWNRAQEWLASRLHLTLGESFSYEAPRDLAERLRRHGFEPQPPRRIDFGYPHPHVLYLAYHQGTGDRGRGTGEPSDGP